MSEIRFEVKYMLKMYYNLHIIKTMKVLLVKEIKKDYGIDSAEYILAKKDSDETDDCIKLLKDMVSTYYNIKDEKELDVKIAAFLRSDPYFKLTDKLAGDFLLKKSMPTGEIN